MVCGAVTVVKECVPAARGGRGALVFMGWCLVAAAVHAAILFAPLLHPQFFGPLGTSVLHDDRIYFDYGSQALAGAVPYRDYVIEYPPLAVPLFVVPRLLTGRFESYVLWFAVEMLAFDAVAVYLVARHSPARGGLAGAPARLVWYTAFFAALYPLIGTRYDLAPAGVALAAAVNWFGGRPVFGGALAASGVWLKIFPAAVAVLAAAAKPRSVAWARARGLLAFAALTLAGGGAWLAMGGAASLAYHLGRGLQVETIWAGALMILGKITGASVGWRYSHSSVELVAPGAGALAALALPAQAAMLVAVARAFRRSGMHEPLRYAAAAILAFILPGKVLSPQYLIWLLPFAPVIEGQAGRVARWVFLLACVATAVEYLSVRRVSSFDLWAVAVLNVRNALLVALFTVLVWNSRRATRGGR